jgi:hypothetical protein
MSRSHFGRASALEAKPPGAALCTQCENIHTRLICLSCSVALAGMLLVRLTEHGEEFFLAMFIYRVTLPEVFSGKRWLELAQDIVK